MYMPVSRGGAGWSECSGGAWSLHATSTTLCYQVILFYFAFLFIGIYSVIDLS